MAAADVTDEVWDHVLLGAPAPRECALPAGLLGRMRREFLFWYPFDLRVRRQGFLRGTWSLPLARPCCHAFEHALCQAWLCLGTYSLCNVYDFSEVFRALVLTCASCYCMVLCDLWTHCLG